MPRSPIRNRIEYLAARLLLGLLAMLPFRAAMVLAARVFSLLDFAMPRWRTTARRNLALAEFPEDSREAIIEAMFRSLARSVACLAKFPRLHGGNIGDWIRYEGLEHFTEAKRRGKGVLFYTAHLGNWELSAFAHGLMSEPMCVMVRPLDNPLLNALASRYRTGSGNRILDKKDSARDVLKALKANLAVGILADQNASLTEGVFVDFFGVKACAHAGFARLAAHSGATVIPGFALWSNQECRYVLRFYPPVEMTGDAAADTQALHNCLESVIRAFPEQWLWIHRRWKTRPPGQPDVY
ncbi:MAG: lysophospholipid acyltransferase family protein [Bryobacteraceae bacterium]|nr:lysophospholipid acyltransferase family protein [Bryobacteraceae bacterium]